MAEAPPAAPAPAPDAKPRSKKMILIVVAAVVVLVGAGAGAYFAFGHKGDEQVADGKPGSKEKGKGKKVEVVKKKGPAIYVKLDPPFVVNFEANGVMRFLQVTVEVMTRDAHAAELVKANDPMIRNDLLLLLSNQQSGDITTLQGKEKLRADALSVVAKVVSSEGGEGKQVEQLFFTSFVMQ